ncbi:TPA: ribosome silencing factor [Candidatus Sumerlaeota bacterium]|nr:ribosome silencing factor [Candidatus Sumerlaeota bacterium]
METLDKAYLAAKIADAMKAGDINLLDVRGVCNFTDCFVVATCSASTLLRSTAHRIQKELRELGVRPTDENLTSSSWMLLDYGDIVVHLFHPDARQYYNLEGLWSAAKSLDWTSLTPKPVEV